MSKRGENIYKRKDGRWEGRYIKGYDDKGKAKYGYIYRKTYKDIKRELIYVKSKTKILSLKNSSNMNLSEWLNYWLEFVVKPNLKDSTYTCYYSCVNNHIIPDIGYLKLTKINSLHIQNFINNINKNKNIKLSQSTLIKIKAVLNSALSKAEELFYFENPCINVKISKTSNKEMRVFTLFEQKSIENVLKNFDNDTEMGILLCLYTGLRIGELCALTWNNIDFNNKMINVQKTIQRIKNFDETCLKEKTKIVIDKPKSISSIRNIPISDFLLKRIKILYELKNDCKKNDFVITKSYNNFIEPRTLQYRFKRVLDIAKISDANFHALRHTFATRCMELGVDIKTLSEILGHSNASITLKKYVHSVEEQKIIAMNKLEIVFAC